jgi:2-polyprenyl-6-methoxyphenol hydroxylase-like FAD-dependent oxidoreductase
MDREGHPHNGSAIAWEGRPRFFIDTKKFTGKAMMAYGQTAITEDLYAAREAAGGSIIDEARNVRLHELTSTHPYLTYEKEGSVRRIDCDYVAGCDGYHGAETLRGNAGQIHSTPSDPKPGTKASFVGRSLPGDYRCGNNGARPTVNSAA